MPISVGAKIRTLTQVEFSRLAYDVMADLFYLRNELGRMFNENVYRDALLEIRNDISTEVPIEVSFRDFRKLYFMDVLASSGGIFELKAVENIHLRHRSQLLNYLMLSGLQHGKLINVKPDIIQHEFVNVKSSHQERTEFSINDSDWSQTDGFGLAEKELVAEFLTDWGTGLDRSLYEEALVHFFGGPENAYKDINVLINQKTICQQATTVCSPKTAFKITTFDKLPVLIHKDLLRFLNQTELETIQWINISRGNLTFKTIK